MDISPKKFGARVSHGLAFSQILGSPVFRLLSTDFGNFNKAGRERKHVLLGR
jgi:hypothetical protein